MTLRVVLARRGSGEPLARVQDDGEDDGGAVVREVVLDDGALPAFVAAQEAHRPRWVWDDTTRWYPSLLAAGVRVQRCTDLRLAHRVLRRSPAVDQGLLGVVPGGDDAAAAAWDALEPVGAAAPGARDEGLFDLHERVGALDAAAELGRQDAAVDASPSPGRLRTLLAAESAGALMAAEMTHVGLPWRADVHRALLAEQLGPPPAPGQQPRALVDLLARLRDALGAPALNPDSPGELLRALARAGLEVPDTRSATLSRLDHPAVPLLLEHRRLSRLHTTNGWRWLQEWVHDGRYRPSYLPGGVVSGRWAAQGGGALSVPAQVRPAVVADPGWVFVTADVAQLEPRVLAAVSGDERLAAAAATGDLYQGVVEAGAAASRADAKTALLGAMYGATAGQGGRLVEHLARRYPRAFGHVEEAARAGERGEQVATWLGRASPPPPAQRDELDERERRAWGRFTRNFVVQGTGAEWALCWTALLRDALWQLGGSGPLTERPHVVLFLHDEVVVHAQAALADDVAAAVRTAAERAGRLLFGGFPIGFPLQVTSGTTWA